MPGQVKIVSVTIAPGEQERHLEGDVRDDRQHRVAEGVLADDRPARGRPLALAVRT